MSEKFENFKTFAEVTREIFRRTVGYINHEKKTLSGFREELRPYFKNPARIPFQVAFEFRRKKKWWYGVIILTTLGYNYYMPRTKQENEELKKEIGEV